MITSFFKKDTEVANTFEHRIAKDYGLTITSDLEEDTNLVITSDFINPEDEIL